MARHNGWIRAMKLCHSQSQIPENSINSSLARGDDKNGGKEPARQHLLSRTQDGWGKGEIGQWAQEADAKLSSHYRSRMLGSISCTESEAQVLISSIHGKPFFGELGGTPGGLGWHSLPRRVWSLLPLTGHSCPQDKV
jgi:hypothetical protein